MKLTWLGQSGLLFESDKLTVLADPFLSESAEGDKAGKNRRLAADTGYLEVSPDVILITHAHGDHLDKETLKRYFAPKDKRITILAGKNAYNEIVGMANGHNAVLLSPHSVWSEGGITFYSIKAEHSERSAVGFIMDDGEKTYYISGDTIYNFDVIDDCLDLVEDGVDYAFLPINGYDCNMNAKDAADFAYEIGAKCAIPINYGMFDDVDPDDFDFEDRRIILPYEKIEL